MPGTEGPIDVIRNQVQGATTVPEGLRILFSKLWEVRKESNFDATLAALKSTKGCASIAEALMEHTEYTVANQGSKAGA